MKRLLLTFLLVGLIISVSYGQTQWVADVTLGWNAAPFATGYKVFLFSEGNPLSQGYDVGDVTQYKIVGLDAGDVYTFSVQAYNQFSMGDFSDPVGVDLRVPGKPSGVKVIRVDGRKK